MACNSGLLEFYHFFAITVCLDSGSNSSWVELTALAAMCAQLTGPNSTEVQVSEPIHISIPLPSDSPLKTATSVPVWRFEHKTGKQHLTKSWLSLNNSTQIDDFIQKITPYRAQTRNFISLIRRVITNTHFDDTMLYSPFS